MVIYAIPTTGGLIYCAMASQGGSIVPIAYHKAIVLPEQLKIDIGRLLSTTSTVAKFGAVTKYKMAAFMTGLSLPWS
jgi:hypothetical protein